jgi:aspartate/methionine/tyrosine aminotransferase
MKISDKDGERQVFFTEAEVLEALCEWAEKKGVFIFKDDIQYYDFIRSGVYMRIREGLDFV